MANPRDVGDIVPHTVALTGGGADYIFDCTGNTTVMRQALECCPPAEAEYRRYAAADYIDMTA